jgi:asparagine synthase (glutamine-hydrolysing)
MVDALCHEHFYQTGTWIDESLGLYVGWAALEGSFSDGMPLQSERGDAVLVFSGEEYTHPRVAQRLKPGGASQDQRQCSYLMRLYEEDCSFPASLNGMFHGVLADRTRGTVTLFNDRYGMHRLYCHESKDAFFFGAEAKAILAARPELRTPSPQGLGEFVACSCVLENRTIFKDINLLPAASAWVFRNAAIAQKHAYFEPKEWEQQTPLDPESYYRQLQDALSQSLPRYFEGPESTGIALTGGMDTRVIMAWEKSASGSLPCYTFGGMFRECQDVRLARKVAKACQQTHRVIEVGDEFLKRFPHYAERSVYLTEGGVDVYRASDLYVSEKAREIAPAKVVGTYGSEIVRHAVMFKPMPPAEGLFQPEFLTHVQRAGDTYAVVRRAHPVTFAAFRQSPWYHHGILALEQSQLTVRSPYLDDNFVRTVFRAPATSNGNGDVRLRLIGDGSPELRQIPSDRGVGGNRGAFSAALSRGFQEFTFKAEYAYDYGMPQWVASVDHLLAPLHLERLFLGRHKFLHYRVWYRDALAEYVRQMLLDPLTLARPYLHRKSLENMVNGHLKGDRNYTTTIHKMLTLELLHRQFFDAR